ncbi:MAG: hypothetical protein L0G70_10840, partial [Rubrobacter sp.]|nr:hypothetical protein [Rubrobacter sp.]
PCLRRVASRGQSLEVADIVHAAKERWEQTLVLAPEIRDVERLVSELAGMLPAGTTVAPYHSGLGPERALVHDAARQGAADVLVGTRAAAFLPLSRPGAICVVDEPDPAHRADPGFEGIPLHVRELAQQRGGFEEAAVVMLSPAPSLAVYASTKPRGSVLELPAPEQESWPAARIVDMRGSGATLSRELLGQIRATLDGGSGRMIPTGAAAERVRELLADEFEMEVGLLTAESEKKSAARVVVGTAHALLKSSWEAVFIPDADALLYASGVLADERAFRTLYSAAESAGSVLLAQTRTPETETLPDALRGDYPAFARRELPRRRKAAYPPYHSLASLKLQGAEKEVRGAVESALRNVNSRAEMLQPVPLDSEGVWRVVIRAGSRKEIAEAVFAAADIPAAGSRKATRAANGSVSRLEIELDPEEV